MYKNNCKLVHPTEDCKIKCSDKKCKFRHRRECKDGLNCYFKDKFCEYVHDVTLASEDSEQTKAHKVILTETSANENIKVIEKLKHDHKEEIEGLKKEMENEKKTN